MPLTWFSWLTYVACMHTFAMLIAHWSPIEHHSTISYAYTFILTSTYNINNEHFINICMVGFLVYLYHI
jgi:hypothetical protein